MPIDLYGQTLFSGTFFNHLRYILKIFIILNIRRFEGNVADIDIQGGGLAVRLWGGFPQDGILPIYFTIRNFTAYKGSIGGQVK